MKYLKQTDSTYIITTPIRPMRLIRKPHPKV